MSPVDGSSSLAYFGGQVHELWPVPFLIHSRLEQVPKSLVGDTDQSSCKQTMIGPTAAGGTDRLSARLDRLTRPKSVPGSMYPVDRLEHELGRDSSARSIGKINRQHLRHACPTTASVVQDCSMSQARTRPFGRVATCNIGAND